MTDGSLPEEWVNRVLEEAVPKIKDSAVVMHLVPTKIDVKICVELGVAIMLDKPIIAVVFGAQPVPAKLRQIADEVVRLPEGVNPEGTARLAQALRRVMERERDD